MFNGIGVIVILVCVFGSFLLSGGSLAVIGHALPYEMMAIAGAAAGAFMLGNSVSTVRKAGRGVARAFRGPRWQEADYRDLLALLFTLLLFFRKNGAAKIENHLDAPADSELFAAHPRLMQDRDIVAFICDYLRMMTVGFDDAHQLAEAMENDVERHHAEEMLPANALHAMADALPALGIVAAVLGVIKTMSSIDQPTAILGAMIASALVGTFLGVLLSYCLVGPLASKLHEIVDADCKPYSIVKTAIIAHAQGAPSQVAVELARRMVPSAFAPSFAQLETSLDAAEAQVSFAKAA